MMSAQDVIEQLEQAFAQSDFRQRAETLRRLTDLFVSGAETLTDEQIDLFDEVMIRLVEEIDVSARAVFGRRLAEVPQAPPRVMRGLALDDAIEVAGPVLRASGDPAPASAGAVLAGERDGASQPGDRRSRQGRRAAGGDRAGVEPAADAAARGVDRLLGGARPRRQAAARWPA